MSFWVELKRRKIFQVAAVYAITAWLLVQIVVSIEAPLNLPDWMDTFVIVCLGIGFPITMIMSWAFNVTSEGLVRDAGDNVRTRPSGKTIEYVLIGLLVVAVGWLLYRDVSGPPVLSAADGTPGVESNEASDAAGAAARDVLPNSIAVLLCDNFSTDPEDGFFAASLHEELLNQLFKLRNLNVVARTSVLQYADAAMPIPQIAQELKVESVMECSVAYGDGRIVISAQLIDGETGLHLWSDRYNRELVDVFGIQADIAMNVANALQAAFSPEEQASIANPYTDNAEAYRLYLQASFLQVMPPTQAQALLDQALALDPEFAAAYARKATWISRSLVNNVLGQAVEDWAEIDREVSELAARALAMDPNLTEAYYATTFKDMVMWRWRAARESLRRALELNGGNVAALGNAIWVNSFAGAHEDAIRNASLLLEQAPNLIENGIHIHLGLAHSFAGDAEAAIGPFETALGFDATNLVARLYLCMALAATGRDVEAEEQLRFLAGLAANSPIVVADVMAVAYARMGRMDEAGRLAMELLESLPAARENIGETAMAYLALSDRDKLAEQLELAVAKSQRHEPDPGFYSLMILKHNVPHHPLLEEPRFVELRDALGRE